MWVAAAAVGIYVLRIAQHTAQPPPYTSTWVSVVILLCIPITRRNLKTTGRTFLWKRKGLGSIIRTLGLTSSE